MWYPTQDLHSHPQQDWPQQDWQGEKQEVTPNTWSFEKHSSLEQGWGNNLLLGLEGKVEVEEGEGWVREGEEVKGMMS